MLPHRARPIRYLTALILIIVFVIALIPQQAARALTTTTVIHDTHALQSTGSVSGTITDSSFNPISTAEVCLSNFSYQWFGCQSVNGDGTYTYGGLSSGTYRVNARAPGYANEFYDGIPYYGDHNNATPVSVTDGQDTPSINIALDPGGTISGTIYAADSVTPLGGVPIDTNPGGFGQCANPDGTYTMSGLPLNTPIIVQGGGSQWGGCATLNYALEYWQNTFNYNDADPITLTSGGGENATGINFTLEEAGTVTGRITSLETGLPIAGADVYLHTPDWSWGVGTTTDGNGDYTFNGILGDYGLQAEADGHARMFWTTWGQSPVEGEIFSVTSGQTTIVNMVLSPGGTLSGRVTYTDGVTGIPVFLSTSILRVPPAPTRMGTGALNIMMRASQW